LPQLESYAPAGLVVQVPDVQVSHGLPQVELQQVLSTQFPDLHWFTLLQAFPLSSLQSMSWLVPQVAAQGVQPDGQKPSDVALQARGLVTQAKVQSETLPVRVSMWFWSLTQASYCVWQADCGSHFSPASTTEFPHTGAQSLSLFALQPGGQQPSAFAQAEMRVVFTHFAVQALAVPCRARIWQPIVGQVVGQLAPSQVSLHAASVTPLPHWQAQSLSFAVVHPDGQQLSPLPQVVMTVSLTQAALQVLALPVSFRFWQPMRGQVVGQLPSQLSPGSTMPSPQRGAQSLSLALLQPVGQQPSPFAHAVCTPSSTQLAVHVAAEPSSFFRMQPFHGHVAGQCDGGSQVSPASTAPLPQRGWQSLSTLALHAAGQQPSPLAHAVWTVSSTHCAWQVPPLTSRCCWHPLAGQLFGQLVSGSQVSWQAGSSWPLPQVQLQSLSFAVVQPDGQHPSPDAHAVCGPSSTQWAVQSVALPASFCLVQPSGAHVVGHWPGGSQLSPASTTPLPQVAGQSLSLLALQPGGQQPSPPMHVVCSRSFTHWAVQVPGLATRRSMHPSGAHDCGQLSSGSQTSPHAASTTPLPHEQLQSLSSASVHPAGQQASPDSHAVWLPASTHTALQVAADPCSS
jgi:hypothetical protein